MSNRWFGPIGGILFTASAVVGMAVSSGIDVEPFDSAQMVLSQFGENADSIETAAFITVLGLGFLLVFIGHLRNRMREGGAGWAADGFLAGGIAVVAAWVVLTGVQLAGGVAGEAGHAEVAQGAIDFLWNSSLLLSPGLLAVGIAAAAASFTSGAIPKWLGVFAVVVALGALAPWIGIVVFVAWVLAASIAELMQVRPDSPTNTPTEVN